MRNRYETASNFVSPAPRPSRPVEIIEVPQDLPSAPTPVLMPQAGYEDRARGFGLATAPLAGVTGLVAALVGILGWQVPIASLATLLLALGGFALTWLLAYLAHVLISPDGSLFVHVLATWAYLRREQAERHRRYAQLQGKGDRHE